MAKIFLIIASCSGFLVVALGAFGAHGLKGRLTQELMTVYQTGVQYHFYHTLALLALGIMLQQYPQATAFKYSAFLMVAGLVIFSGSLYVLAFTGVH